MPLKACVFLLTCAAVAHGFNGYTGPLSEPLYTLQTNIAVDNAADVEQIAMPLVGNISTSNVYHEWEGYDGWYNNPAHPEWGGAGE